MSKIYLAARYSRHPEMQVVAQLLREMGHAVTARWIQGGHEITKEGSTEAAHAERIRFATEDTEDLESAEIVVCFTEEPRKTATRGGRHVEFGMALALRKRLVVVGWRETVFHCLPAVEYFAGDWLQAANYLRSV